jgi:hypothetical protein
VFNRKLIAKILLVSFFLFESIQVAQAVVAPTISSQPTSIVVASGTTSFNLTVTATVNDGGTLSYQWYKRAHLNDNSPTTLSNTSRISGATTRSLTIGASGAGNTVAASDAGIFYVIVTNTLSGSSLSTTSSNAVVVITLLDEDFRDASLSNSSDWVFTYNNSSYANSARSLQGGTNSTANEYFQPCLTAASGAATTVTSGATEATVGAGTDKTVSVLGSCNGSALVTTGNGALRMSSNRLDTKSSAVFTREISTASGLDISFGFASYGGLEGAGTGRTADGSGFYLKAGSSTDYAPGGAGGAIGYARRVNETGVDKGLFAIGLDAYGNVGQANHVGNNCAAGTITDFNGTTYTAVNNVTTTANKIALLGPTGATRLQGYCLMTSPTGTATTTLSGYSGGSRSITFTNPSVSNRTSGTNSTCTVCKDVRIIVDSSAIASADRKIYVIVDGTVRYEVNQPQALKDSSTFKFGFSSATGGSSIISEFWGINVRTFTGVTAPDRPTSVSAATANNVDSSKTISWTAPAAWGIGELASGATGAVNRSYVARIIDSSGNETGWNCATTSTSCTIEGITSGTYTARVTAINRSGISSLPSDGSSSFTSTLTVQTTCSTFARIINGSFEDDAIQGTNGETIPLANIGTGTVNEGNYLWRGYNGSTTAEPTMFLNLQESSYASPSATIRRINGWETTSNDGKIEIQRQRSGYEATENTYLESAYFDRFGPTPAQGSYWAELNADEIGALYQDIITVPNTIMRWSIKHRGREEEDEEMQVKIGATNSTTAQVPIARRTPNTIWGTTPPTSWSTDSGYTSSSTITGRLSSGWVEYQGSYTIPANQTTTRFSFESNTPGSVANFLDDIVFTPLAACPDLVVGTASTSQTVNVLLNDYGYELNTLAVINASQVSGPTVSAVTFSGNNITFTPPSNFNANSDPIVISYTFRNGSNSNEISSARLTIIGSCNSMGQLQNGDFETPVVEFAGSGSILEDAFESPGTSPFWIATQSDDPRIEVWRQPVAGTDGGAISDSSDSYAKSGRQLAELAVTAHTDGIYQDLPTVEGAVIRYKFSHHRRSSPPADDPDAIPEPVVPDEMQVRIGATNSPSVNVPLTHRSNNATQSIASNGFLITSDNFWHDYSGAYVAGTEGTTRIQFAGVSSGGGFSDGGNLIDAIEFSTLLVCPFTRTVVSGNSLNINVFDIDGDSVLDTEDSRGTTQSNICDTTNDVSGGCTTASITVSGLAGATATVLADSSGRSLQFTAPSGVTTQTTVQVQISIRNEFSDISSGTITFQVVPEGSQRGINRYPIDPRVTSANIRSVNLTSISNTNIYTCIDLVTANNSTEVDTSNTAPTLEVSDGGVQTSSNSARSLTIRGSLADSRDAIRGLRINAQGANPVMDTSGTSRWLLIRMRALNENDPTAPTCSTVNRTWIELSPLKLTRVKKVVVSLQKKP